MKYITARLKEQVEVTAEIGGIDFQNNWLEASSVIEHAKRKTISTLKNEMHKRIAELSIDDIEFKIIN